MAYRYKHFIPENTAPKGAVRIGVYDSSGAKVCTIPLGRLTPVVSAKLYSFGLVSDIHFYKKGESWVTWDPEGKFDKALSFFENDDCVFCAHCGDITQTGLYDDGDKVNLQPAQFAHFKEICDKHTIPVHGCCGNHESYVVDITNNLTELKTYTGRDLYYTVSQGNDVFIFVGQSKGSKPMSDEAFQWLGTTLEANKNKRCFVFVHPYISSGNPVGAYKTVPIFENWNRLSEFKSLLSQYKNTIIFHGHSHTKFECQELDTTANYSTSDGFKSVHVPSSSSPRDVVNGELVVRYDESQGYLVDVYEDCIVLNGMDFINNKPVPLGTYKISTTV